MCSTVLLCITWKKAHFIILRLLTNSLHSEPMRHAQASLKEALNNVSIPFCFINSPHLPFFLSHSLFYPHIISGGCYKLRQHLIYKCMPIMYQNSNDRKHGSPSETHSSTMMSLACKFSLKLWHLGSFLSSRVTVTWFLEVLSTHHLLGETAGTGRAEENTFMQSICLALGTQVLNCYSGFSFTA